MLASLRLDGWTGDSRSRFLLAAIAAIATTAMRQLYATLSAPRRDVGVLLRYRCSTAVARRHWRTHRAGPQLRSQFRHALKAVRRVLLKRLGDDRRERRRDVRPHLVRRAWSWRH